MRPLRPASVVSCLALTLVACSEATPASSTGEGPTPDGGGPDAEAPSTSNKPRKPVPPFFIGTGGYAYGYGSAFAGATAPAGLAKVGPDTKGPWGTISFLHFSGYWYDDDVIRGFSHLHLHGTGATDYGVLAMMPSDGFDASRTTPDGYSSPFQKKNESLSPGLYSVTLDRGNIAVEIAATSHAAHHRYTYPSGATSAHVIIDLDHHLESGTVKDAEAVFYPAEKRVAGRLRSLGGMSAGFGGYDVFFEMRTNKPWSESLAWQGGGAPAVATEVKGTGAGFTLAFDVTDATPVEVVVGLSLVSSEGAAANLAAEIPTFAFDATKKKTADSWNALLDRVRFDGGTEDQRNMMTAAVYHLYLMPTAIGDVDGKYRFIGDEVRLAEGFRFVSDMSLWDTYRTLHPLYSLIAPEYARDSVRSLHEMAKVSGFFPKWPLATGETGTMLGASAEVVLADAYIKGVTDFDAEGAYALMRAAAMDPVAPVGGRGGRNDVEPYMTLGYVPFSKGSSVSKTTEFAVDDFALAELAAALGHASDATALRARALGYRKLYDPETGFLWAKNEDGSFASSHTDPTLFAEEFAEADAWQSLWMVAQDIDGLAELAGGRTKLVAKLEELFDKGKVYFNELDWTNPLTSAAPHPYYWGSNEPDMHAPYVFAQLGRPDLAQKWIVWVRENVFGPGADGLPGNDDGGTMSAWYVFTALGFYPLPGTDRYIIGTPMFPHAEIAVTGGTFTVEAPEVSTTNIYVQEVKLNGKPLDVAELRHSALAAGGTLEFSMGDKPSAWARVD